MVLHRTVRSDIPMGARLRARPGIYEAVANQYGAVAVVLPEGTLGLKPGEFQWIEMEEWLSEFWDGDHPVAPMTRGIIHPQKEDPCGT